MAMRYIASLFLMTAAFSAIFAGMATADSVEYGDHNITFLGVTGPDDGLCTWEYLVCSGTGPSVSHWILESCVGTTNDDIQWATDPDLGGHLEYGYDPTTGITGLKFDDLPEDFGCAVFAFRVKECSVTDQEVGIKAGGDVHTGSYIEGPAHDVPAPEFPAPFIPAAVSVAVISAVFALKKR